MKRIICEFSLKQEHAQVDACFVIVMSHGNSEEGVDYLVTSDNRKIEITEIVSQFDGHNSKVLRGKPKVFLFQSCRGGKKDTGVTDAVTPGSFRIDGTGQHNARRTMPRWNDVLIAHSTVHGQYPPTFPDANKYEVRRF